jgi:hypothetical protein
MGFLPPDPTRQLSPTTADLSQSTTKSRRLICGLNGCAKSYGRKYELHRHQRAHSGIRSYSCGFDRCDRSGHNGFARKDHLMQHLRQVHKVLDISGTSIVENVCERGSR